MAGKKGLSGRKPAEKPAAPEGRPIKASWLNADGSEFWETTVALLEMMPGKLSVVDENALNCYAMAYQEYVACIRAIEKEGRTSYADNGSPYTNPHVKQMQAAQRQMVGYEKQFGLTPAARKQLGMKTEEKQQNKFAHLLGGTRPTLKMEAS